MLFLKRIFIILFSLVFTVSFYAQDKNKPIALLSIIKSLEKQYDVVFNFIDKDVIPLQVIPPSESLSLNEKIIFLEQETELSFENINNQYFNIYKNTDSDSKIYGFIYAKESNKPLENVTVLISNKIVATTNSKGYFELKIGTETEIECSYIGFKKVIIPISVLKQKHSKIFLEVDVSELHNIFAYHYLTFGVSKKNNGSFEITPKKLGLLPGLIESDVLQTMQQIPGINSADESVESINVRGGTHDQNLFLWNGIKMYQTGHFFGLISVFNPNVSNTISIYKNGTSAFYGESVSSVMDLNSDNLNDDKNTFSAGINMINADIYSKFNLTKKSFIEIFARRSINDIFEFPTYKEYFNKAFQNIYITNSSSQNINYNSDEKFLFYDLTTKYVHTLSKKDKIIMDLITINDELKVYQTSSNTTVSDLETNTLYQKNYGGNLSWFHHWNQKNKSKLNAYSSSYELDAQKNNFQNNQSLIQENRVLDNGVKLENNHTINSKFIFNNGYQFNEIGVSDLDQVNSPAFSRKNKTVLDIHSIILEGKYTDSIARIYLSTGLRTNYINQFQKVIYEPRLQLNYGLNKHLNLEILGEMKSQNAFQIIDLQKDYFGIDKRRWVLSNNTSIPIQKSKQISINFTFNKYNWLLSLENYYKKVTGINSAGQGFQNQLEFLKINGQYTAMGTEILVQKKWNHYITWLSYTYNQNHYHFNDFSIPEFSNNFELNHVASWAGIYEKEHFRMALGAKWYSGRPFTTLSNETINLSNPSNPTIDYNIPNNSHLKSFLQINFSTTFKWNSSEKVSYKLGLSVINLLNHQNEINEYYRINTATNVIEDVKVYSLKRTPNVSFRVSF